MTATGAHHLQVPLADLASDALQLSGAQAMQLIWMRQLAEMHAPGLQWGSAYALRSGGWRRITPLQQAIRPVLPH